MTITIPDDILVAAGLTEKEALIEFACRLFDAEKLGLFQAGKLAGLSRVEMECELRKRNIAIYRPTLQDVERDMATLKNLGV
jgi:predicted HTH domain antitoxin